MQLRHLCRPRPLVPFKRHADAILLQSGHVTRLAATQTGLTTEPARWKSPSPPDDGFLRSGTKRTRAQPRSASNDALIVAC